MEKEHMQQLDCDQLSIKSAARNKKQTCINKNILINAVCSAALIEAEQFTEDAWTWKPWNKIASTSTRLSANTLPAATPRPSDSNSSLRSPWCPHITVVHRLIPGSSATSRHGPPCLIQMQKIFSSPSCQASMSMYLWCDTAHVTCPDDLCTWRSRCTLLKRGSDNRSAVDCSAIVTCILWNEIALRAVFKNKHASFWAAKWNQTLPILPAPLFFACLSNVPGLLRSKVLQIHLQKL